MLQGSFPNFVKFVHINWPHFMMIPIFQSVYQTSSMTSMNHFARHWYLSNIGDIARYTYDQYLTLWPLKYQHEVRV